MLLESTTALATGQFRHLACTWNGTTLSLYIDGVLNASTAQTLTPAGNTAPLFIGQYGGNSDRLDGIIDEVRIYNSALTQAEIQALMSAGPPPSPVPSNCVSFNSGYTLGQVIWCPRRLV